MPQCDLGKSLVKLHMTVNGVVGTSSSQQWDSKLSWLEILSTADFNSIELERVEDVEDRKVAHERELEGKEFKDAFVTDAFKKHKDDMRKLEEEEERRRPPSTMRRTPTATRRRANSGATSPRTAPPRAPRRRRRQ
ncbi:hypothetical protein BDR26DRAFT_894098 [Obelidium mucronatum]|nr:hypothetical protein BDR26DRAFT_894415 [Obelidium mucronatum]KAI9344040.1 hypothetical protein BDR26DRAFT_894098 [Obelidium mucronatum]